jgi:hypothetical protein
VDRAVTSSGGNRGTLALPTVQVRAAELRRGDGVLLPETGNDVHEVVDARHAAGRSKIRTRNTRTGEEREHQVASTSLWKKVLLAISGLAMLAGMAAGAFGLGSGGHADADTHPRGETTSQVVRSTLPDAGAGAPTRAHVPAPTTVKGYADMWASIDPAEWGGADVSISVPLPDGRAVWLYGDTLSGNNGFVHSTAIVQDGGSLHVSAGGKQLLPNDDDHHIYWVEDAKSIGGGQLAVDASPMEIGNKSAWDFHRTRPEARRAIVQVDANGDVHFVKWAGWVKGQPIEPTVTILGPNHYAYGAQAHPEVKLASGKTLYTVAQNWDDGFDAHRNADGSLRYSDWRPMFEAR